MMKKKLVFLALAFIGFSNYSCKEKCSDQLEPPSVGDFAIQFDFRNVDGALLIKDSNGVYAPTDIDVLDQNLKKNKFSVRSTDDHDGTKHYYLFVPIIQDETNPYRVGVIYRHKVFINLKSVQDLVDYEFKIQQLDCGQQLEYLNVKYNGQSVNVSLNLQNYLVKIVK